MTIATQYPSIAPSLNLNFAATKALDPRITFSRATTGTVYDGKTVVKAEENLVTYSQDFSNAAWTKSGSTVTANAGTAPDGTSTATSLVETSATTSRFVLQIPSMVTANTFTASAYIQNLSGTRNWQLIVMQNGGQHAAGVCVTSAGAFSNIVTGGSINTNLSVASYSITQVGSTAWYRVSVTVNAATAASCGAIVALSNSTAYIPSYAGDGTSGIYIWGAQLEQRSTVTAYTPTTTTPITNYIPALQTSVSNDARFDHDPVTGESKGLLIEEQRTNLLTYSSEFDNAVWTKSNTTISANTVVAPDGTLTGDKLIEDTTANSTHELRFAASTISSAAYSGTFYAKAGERGFILCQIGSTTNGQAFFNLSNGTLGTVTSGYTASITPVGNGWYRCSVSGTIAGTSLVNFRLYMVNGAGTAIYTGDGYSGIYIWGAQLEAGSFPTSYIPTVASQVTRSADSASMSGTNFSSWFNQAEGTTYVEARPFKSISSGFVSLDEAVPNNRLNLYINSSGILTAQIGVAGGGSLAVVQSGAAQTGNTPLKAASSYAVPNYISVTQNGVVPSVSTAFGTPWNKQRMLIGSFYDGQYLNGTIKRIAYYPKRLSNQELQGLTS